MPQLVKGGKWVFGWTVVSSAGEVRIPPEAYAEYGFPSATGFQNGERLLVVRGSGLALGSCNAVRSTRKHPGIRRSRCFRCKAYVTDHRTLPRNGDRGDGTGRAGHSVPTRRTSQSRNRRSLAFHCENFVNSDIPSSLQEIG